MPLPAPVLVAREAELAGLDQLIQAGGLGPVAVLVTGAAGVGKTALVQHVAARHQGPLLQAQGVAWESGRPGGVLDQLLQGEPVPADPFAAAEQLVQRAAGGAESRGLVVVDDAHWADPESIQALSTAVRHHHEAAFTVVLVTTDHPPDASSTTLEVLHRAATYELRVPPFDPAAVAEMAAAHGVHLQPAAAEQLCRHTGGVARHIAALLAELPRSTWTETPPQLPAPAAVTARVREQLARCGPATRALVEALAVLGPAPAREAGLLAGIEDLLAALDEAHGVGLLAGSGLGPAGKLALADPLVATAVIAEMGPRAAADAHRRAADIVEDPVRRLRHLVAATAGPDAALADRLDELARQRASEGAWAAAAALFADASRISEDRPARESRLTRAVDALVGAGDVVAAAALVPELESLRETPLLHATLGYLAIVRGRAVEAESRLARAWDLVNVERDPDIAALVCQRHVLHALARCQGEELVRWADRTIELGGPGEPAAVEAAAIRGLGLAAAGRQTEAAAAYRDLAQRVRHGAQAQRVTMGKGWLHLVMDEVDQARAELESALPTTYLGGSRRISLWAHGWLARTLFMTGEWDAALRTAREGLELVERSGMVLVAPLLHWTGAQIRALRGDWDLAAQALRDAETGSQDYEIMRVPALLARAQVAEAQADYGRVVETLAPLTQTWAHGAVDEPGFWPWTDVYANALVLEGRLEQADAFLVPHEQRAAARDHRSTRARLGYARGRWYGARGDLDAARDCFTMSLRLLEDLPLRYDRARVNFAFGQTLRRAGKRREADVVMSAARDSYAALGASTYVRRCDRELKAGGRAGSRDERELDELTPQEEAVAGLVARGLSNREVAAELYVSAKTVQYHLTRVYAKLKVRSRAELAALWRQAAHADG